MLFWKNSLVYRLCAGSWVIGWLFAPPDQESVYYDGSRACTATGAIGNVTARVLQKAGAAVKRVESGSLLVNRPAGFLGMLLFFYFSFDLVLHDYALTRAVLESALALTGLLMALLYHWPGLWQGTLAYRLWHWWQDTD